MAIAAVKLQAEKGWFDFNAITYDAASTSGCQVAQSVYSWSHTTNGLNRCLYVGVSLLSAAGTTVSGITYNGVALTKIRHDANAAARSEMWRLVAPALGTNTIEVTLSAAITSDAGAVSFNGVFQATPEDGQNGATGTNDPASVGVTTTYTNSWLMDTVATSDTAITVGTNQTERWNNSCTVGSGAGSTRGPIATPATTTMQWDNVGALDIWAISSLGIRSVSGAAVSGFTSPHHMALMGMGV